MTEPPNFAAFDHQPRTRILFGAGVVERTGEMARESGISRALLVTDRGVVAAGHTDRARAALEKAGVKCVVYDKTRENPTSADVEHCREAAQREGIDGIIGLGGGSSMDTAKGCNFLLTNGGRMQDYWGVGKAAKPMLPLLAIPTTAGTGSECQSFALIADEKTHQKMACGDPKAAARVALLDPELTLSQPPHVAACAGVDALSHALETAVTRRRNAISLAYSREAFRLCWASLPGILAGRSDLGARAGMLAGAALAGMAIENSMLGAAHAAANPLTAHYGIVHGQAVGLMLGPTLLFNAGDPAIRPLYETLGAGTVEDIVRGLNSLLDSAQMPQSLPQCGVAISAFPELAEEAASQWTAAFNPRSLKAKDFVELYELANSRVDNALK